MPGRNNNPAPGGKTRHGKGGIMKAQELVENFINGNITEARKGAKNRRRYKLCQAFYELAGFSLDKAAKTAIFLKTGRGWQAACDAE